jgi:hypothetical protein
MPGKLFVLTLLFVLPGPAFAGPPDHVSGRIVFDEVPELRAKVQQREKESSSVKSDPARAEALAEARARLAEAEDRPEAAAAEWRKVVASRRTALADLERLMKAGRLCSGIELVMQRGRLADARYRLAEVEKDRPALAAELPKVIAYKEAQLDLYQSLREARALGPEDAKEERVIRRELTKARLRLDEVKKK